MKPLYSIRFHWTYPDGRSATRHTIYIPARDYTSARERFLQETMGLWIPLGSNGTIELCEENPDEYLGVHTLHFVVRAADGTTH